ncbi:ATP-binding cassette domain-containing protein [Steroidobacter agaridevorans]|uniref:ATP-binding cassette domain-containing protein n=1 Tax=Steroidobacter agaridevorans TaxID=2695856 RepID=UPI001328E8FE|nr:ATP-binding cassette domain-containing protein [Steroidobacter agaridevorans]GFE86042.1 ABC transporter ATP-binding protein [Steroidobacter agaridevorans]
MNAADDFIVRGDNLTKRFERQKLDTITALDRVSFGARPGALTALVGPDGAGKTTLLRLAAGLMRADEGSLTVLGLDAAKQPQAIQDRISYMPQRFGLYEDLSVQENLDLYADLHGVTPEQRAERYPRLMEMTALAPFLDRLAGKLSGGMKQKLGLACTLVRSPELLLLDEPTVGVDPLSRRELWDIVSGLVENEGLSVIVSTSYMDEAERCAHVVVLHEGHVLASGTPQELMSRASGHSFLAMSQRGTPARKLQADLIDRPDVIDAVPHGGQVRVVLGDREPLSLQDVTFEPTSPILEDSLMMLLRHKTDEQPAANAALELTRKDSLDHSEVVIEVHDLVRKFGDFTAVNRTSFEVKRGEVFGLLGPNGAGKTTTFRMLCGLLPATSGTLKVAGADLRRARAEARQNIGYVAQKFSLYGDISVLENLQFFAGAYGLRNSRAAQRIEWALDNFELKQRASSTAGSLPGGFQRRLAMAAALLHEPAIVFLDEPTSGADPLARREFWRRIGSLADHGTTIVVTTHFMEEAEYCDRIMIQDAGTMLAIGTPEEVRRQAGSGGEPAHSMEDAFIGIVEQGRERAQRQEHAA